MPAELMHKLHMVIWAAVPEMYKEYKGYGVRSVIVLLSDQHLLRQR